ncbi:MAG: hypothetical protein AB8B64_22225 [Granulosicoccus sp.]
MNSLRIAGAASALLMASIYLLGFAIFFSVLDPGRTLTRDESIQFLSENRLIVLPTIFVLYVLAGFNLLILVQSLAGEVKDRVPWLSQTALIIGSIWCVMVIVAGFVYLSGMQAVFSLYPENAAQASTLALMIDTLFESLGGGNELIGGVWTVLISCLLLNATQNYRILHFFGIAVGIAGVVSIVPMLAEAVTIFGLGQIFWFIGLGVRFLRNKRRDHNPRAHD